LLRNKETLNTKDQQYGQNDWHGSSHKYFITISQLFKFNCSPVSMHGDFVCNHFSWESDEASIGSTVSASIHGSLDALTNSGGVDTVQPPAHELHME